MDVKIAALVILYNYNNQCLENIRTYLEDVDIVFAFDNSTKKNQELESKLKSMQKIYYIDGHGNQGLSHAINLVAHKAIKMGYQWLITFDQDSTAYNNIIEQMKEFISTSTEISQIGLIGPVIKSDLQKFNEVKYKISYNDWLIQSGALHNLEAYKAVKGYDENLFIDQVDIEYCARLKRKGYKIVKLNHAILAHNNQDDNVKVIHKKYLNYVANKYSPTRYYYYVRNNLYCAKKYKNINPKYYDDLKNNIKKILHTLPYEDDKWPRLIAVVYGFLDYKMGKMGKTNRKL